MKRIIGILIIILTILLAVVLFYIADLTMLKKEGNNDNTINKINVNSIKSSDNNSTVNHNATNNTQNNVSNNIVGENDLNESDIYFDKSNYSVEINGITDEISKYIKDQNELKKKLIEFVWNNGLANSSSMEVEKYEYQESTGRLGIIFKLNNPDENKLRVIINANGNIDISNYN